MAVRFKTAPKLARKLPEPLSTGNTFLFFRYFSISVSTPNPVLPTLFCAITEGDLRYSPPALIPMHQAHQPKLYESTNPW